MEKIKLFNAIKEMRKISKEKGNFSITFMSYDRSRQQSGGVVEMTKTRLRSSAGKDINSMADHQLELLNLNTNEPRRCYQPAIMFFNGKQVTVN